MCIDGPRTPSFDGAVRPRAQQKVLFLIGAPIGGRAEIYIA